MKKLLLLTQIITLNSFAMSGGDSASDSSKMSYTHPAPSAMSSKPKGESELVPELVFHPKGTEEHKGLGLYGEEVFKLGKGIFKSEEQMEGFQAKILKIFSDEFGDEDVKSHKNAVSDFVYSLTNPPKESGSFDSYDSDLPREKVLETNPYRSALGNHNYESYVKKVIDLIENIFEKKIKQIKEQGDYNEDQVLDLLLKIQDHEFMKEYYDKYKESEKLKDIRGNSPAFAKKDAKLTRDKNDTEKEHEKKAREYPDIVKNERTKVQEKIFSHFCNEILGSEFSKEMARLCAIAVQLRIQDILQYDISKYKEFVNNCDLSKYNEQNDEIKKLNAELDKSNAELDKSNAYLKKINDLLALKREKKSNKPKDNNLTAELEKELGRETNIRDLIAKQTEIKVTITQNEGCIELLKVDIKEAKQSLAKLNPLSGDVAVAFDRRAGEMNAYLDILVKNHSKKDKHGNLFIGDNGNLSRGYYRIVSHLSNMAKHGIDPYEYPLEVKVSESESEITEEKSKNPSQRTVRRSPGKTSGKNQKKSSGKKTEDKAQTRPRSGSELLTGSQANLESRQKSKNSGEHAKVTGTSPRPKVAKPGSKKGTSPDKSSRT